MFSKHAFTALVTQCISEVIVDNDNFPQEYWRDAFGKKMPGEFTVEASQPPKPEQFEALVKECVLDVLKEELTAPFHMRSLEEGLGEDAGKWVRKLVIAGFLSWAALTSDGRNAVKQAYKALQLNTAVPQQVQQQIQDEVPYTGVELDKFIQSQIEHRDKIDKEVGPVSKKILTSPSFVRDEPMKEGFVRDLDLYYWMDKNGKFYKCPISKFGDNGHYAWAKLYLDSRKIPLGANAKDTLINIGFLKIVVNTSHNIIGFEGNPNSKQLRNIKDYAIEHEYKLRDDLKNRQISTEGFDPMSAGPNPEATEGTQYNPYPQWNAEMRKMEESDPHGRYAQEAGAGEFDNRTFGVTEYSLPENEPELTPKEKLAKLIRFLTRVHSVCDTISPEDQAKLNRCLDELAEVINRYD